ncbi:heavy metal-associated domain-containing protein [Lacinutrix neustonica]|uniref:Heavy metal-associated domain-containing protein n=1 Tax=Lacinutrix neustonica TaxID=2980107 RepID=A0A9E8MV96_9FLAO|nr:heavy metal-associated domain-containing protein [Lacinutrix neustonica]WAC01257.1 heavy metal-associated domain-containing protein [Lacinutrix neustonica]
MTVETAVEETESTVDANATYAKAEFKIEGMTCAMGCAKTIENKMAKMEGVKSAKVDFDRELAMVEYDEAKVTPASLEGTVTSVADTYKVKDMKTVEMFSTVTSCTMACCEGKTDAEKAACTMDCCKNKSEGEKMACKADCKKDCCKNKTEAEKVACAKDCKKACCAKEVKA